MDVEQALGVVSHPGSEDDDIIEAAGVLAAEVKQLRELLIKQRTDMDTQGEVEDELQAEVARLREALTSVREIALRPRRADMTEEELVDCLFEVRQAVREVSDGR